MTSKRVLILGAETELGAETARALAEAGHILALIAATPDPEAAFAVQRLARKFVAISQAIDAENEMAVRVMVRQVAKKMGGIDAVVMCANPLPMASAVAFENYATRQMEKLSDGVFINVTGPKVYATLQEGPDAGPPPPPSPVKYVEMEPALIQSLGSPPYSDTAGLPARIVQAIADQAPTA